MKPLRLLSGQVLLSDKFVVFSSFGNELSVRPTLSDLAVLDVENQVRVLDGR